MLEFIDKHFTGTLESKSKCLSKATIIVFENNMILIADTKYIYYFGTTPNNTKSKKFYSFYKKHQKDMKLKLFISEDISRYENHCELISTSPKGIQLCKWL